MRALDARPSAPSAAFVNDGRHREEQDRAVIGREQDRGGFAVASVDDDHGQVGARHAGVLERLRSASSALRRSARIATSHRFEASGPLADALVGVDQNDAAAGGSASRAAARASRPAWPPPSTSTVRVSPIDQRARLRGGVAHVERRQGGVERDVVRIGDPRQARGQVRGAGDGHVRAVAVDLADRLQPQRSQRQRHHRHDPRADRWRVREVARRPPGPFRSGSRPTPSPGCTSCPARRRS